jgi:hypothetical protein
VTRSTCIPLAAMGFLLASAAPTAARTIELTDEMSDRMAAFVAEAPLAGWASQTIAPGCYGTHGIELRPASAFLIRYPLDAIPAGMRITKAELVVPMLWRMGREPRLFLWRILPEWGAGACHLYRLQRPGTAAWSAPGARGSGDRATRPTVVRPLTAEGEQVLNVTQDVELWYTAAAANNGWLFTTEDADARILLASPLGQGRGTWKLRITYEPRAEGRP